MKQFHLIKPLMIAAILLLALFQGYWLTKLYNDEYHNLKKTTDVIFRETLYKLQRQRFEKDSQLTAKPIIANIANNQQPTATIVPASKSKKETVAFSSITINKSVDSVSGFRRKIADSLQKRLSVPPPELLEVMMRFKKHANDSDMMLLRLDTLQNKMISFAQFADKPISIFVRKKAKDSSLKILNDSNINIISFSKTFTKVIDSTTPNKTAPKISFTTASNQSKTVASPIVKYFANNKTINDSIPVKTVDSAYKNELAKAKCNVPCKLTFKVCDSTCSITPIAAKDTGKNFVTSTVYLGFNTPFAYNAQFSKVPMFILQKMQLQIAGSLLLMGIVVFAFIAMYNSLNEQRKLAVIKNEFISNITHELKTPIATVNVAIEALRSFNAINDPEKTKEYLNISASELNRLSLLVDNVLKLSMFENKAIILNKEWVAVESLIKDVLNSLQLQFQKKKATIHFAETNINATIWADKLHLTSVLYNLLDNALKYSTNPIQIHIKMGLENNQMSIQITDNGLGIPAAYQQKIFDKFFRVPTNDRHNIKGYGLGLSYVAHIVNMHNGSIQVQSEEGKGSTFTVKLPEK